MCCWQCSYSGPRGVFTIDFEYIYVSSQFRGGRHELLFSCVIVIVGVYPSLDGVTVIFNDMEITPPETTRRRTINYCKIRAQLVIMLLLLFQSITGDVVGGMGMPAIIIINRYTSRKVN